MLSYPIYFIPERTTQFTNVTNYDDTMTMTRGLYDDYDTICSVCMKYVKNRCTLKQRDAKTYFEYISNFLKGMHTKCLFLERYAYKMFSS